MATSQDFVNWVCSEALEPRFLMQALLGVATGVAGRRAIESLFAMARVDRPST